MSKFVTYPAVTVLDNDHSLLIDDPNAGTNSITAENAGNTLLSKWAGFETFDEAVQNTIEHNQEFIDRDTAIREETAELKKKIVTTFPAKDASGAVATFESEFEDAPLKSCIVQIEPVQEGSGDPSPDNVRPITGWTGCEVQRTGKNLLDQSAYVFQTTTQNGLTYTVQSDGTIHATGTATSIGGPALTNRFNLPNGTYTYLNEASQGIHCAYRGQPVSGGSTFSLPNPFTVNGTFMVYINLYCKATGTYDLTVHPQIKLGSTATSYEPYQGQTYPITFPTEAGTIYGGYVDVINGELVVDRVIASVASVMNKFEGADGYYWYSTATTLGIPNISGLNAELISDRFVKSIYITATTSDGKITFYPNNIIRWKERGDLALADYITYLASNPFRLCYELAEPIHYPITAIDIKTLLGQNNLWADTGDVSVEYLMSDVSWYVEKKLRAFQSILAGVEDSSTASKNYSANTYLIFNDDIYRVTKAITAGETIEEGVNVTKTTVAEQLLALAQA